jgi:photosystem II stability/assembly factor-like uncharacterized protein
MLRLVTGTVALTGAVGALSIACSDNPTPTQESPSPSITANSSGPPTLTQQHSGTTNRLQAISPVNARVAWASGTGGTFTRTTDGGQTWHAGVVPGAETLEFRDVEGVSARIAYLLSAGTGTDARIYKTEDAGRTWQLQFKNRDPAAFFDCFAFWNPDRALVMVDPVEGRFPIRRTLNGRFWQDIGDRLPPALEGEFAFAASGTCVATQGQQNAWLATGGAEEARILATTDGGNTWQAYETPIIHGTPNTGIFTVAFRNARHGILAGGDVAVFDARTKNVAVTADGGKTWELAKPAPFPSAVYGLSYVPGGDGRTVVITGPGGAAWSLDEGESWTRLRGVRNFWAVAFADRGHGWLVGTEGRITLVSF